MSDTTITENSWIKLSVRSSIAVIGSIVVAVASFVYGYFAFQARCDQMERTMTALQSTLKSSNNWTINDMADYGTQTQALNWSVVREGDHELRGFSVPDARKIHNDNL